MGGKLSDDGDLALYNWSYIYDGIKTHYWDIYKLNENFDVTTIVDEHK
jgi:hypothetical protein